MEASRIWLQNFHRPGETDSWRAQTKPCEHQEPRERRSVTTIDWTRLACQCPGVSREGLGWGGLLYVQEHWIQQCWPKFFGRGREHNPTHQQKVGLKFTEYDPAHQNKTQIPPQSVSPSEGRKNENQNHKKLTKLTHRPQPCLTQYNYEPCHVGPPKTDGSRWEFWQNVVHWRRE